MVCLPIYQEIHTITIPDEIKSLLNTKCDILVAFSGGKDSVAMVLYLLEIGISKERIILHHHDVDGRKQNLFDWACTPSYCKAFATQELYKNDAVFIRLQKSRKGANEALVYDGEKIEELLKLNVDLI